MLHGLALALALVTGPIPEAARVYAEQHLSVHLAWADDPPVDVVPWDGIPGGVLVAGTVSKVPADGSTTNLLFLMNQGDGAIRVAAFAVLATSPGERKLDAHAYPLADDQRAIGVRTVDDTRGNKEGTLTERLGLYLPRGDGTMSQVFSAQVHVIDKYPVEHPLNNVEDRSSLRIAKTRHHGLYDLELTTERLLDGKPDGSKPGITRFVFDGTVYR
jgi:hypothetical protein